MKTLQVGKRAGWALGIVSMAVTAQADLITTIPSLPPLGGVYLSTDVHAIFGGPALQFILSLPQHKPIADEFKHNQGPNEIEHFNSKLNADLEVVVNGVSQGTTPIEANGPVQTIVFGKVGNTTGFFTTEMLAMNLSGVSPMGPFMIRESPTLASTGQTSIIDIGGGLYRIASFFDVFTELSIDGGQNWMPQQNGPARVTLYGVPETTSSLGLLATGLIGLIGLRWFNSRHAVLA